MHKLLSLSTYHNVLKAFSARWMVFILMPILVIVAYSTVFGIGELAVHVLAISQYTMMAVFSYAIAQSLMNRAESSSALDKAMNNSMSAAIVFAVIILARVITFAAIAIAYTLFMTNSRALG